MVPTEKKNPPAPAPETPQQHKQALERELHSIYDDQTGAPKRDMTRLDQARHSTAKRLLVGLSVFFAALAAVSWAGFFFFSPAGEKFKGEGVELSIEGPGEVKSGALVTYAVRWKNAERVALGTASLEVRLPKSFHLQKTDPSSENGALSIGSIAPGKEGMLTIEGVFLAPKDKELDVQAILTYRPADFNSEFQKVATRTVKITDSVLGLDVSGPTKVLPGDKVTVTFDYRNESANAFEDVRLRALWPESFIPESSEPASVENANREWVIKSLPADGKGTVKVTGSFASSAEGRQEIKGQMGFIGIDEQFELQTETTYATDVLKGDLVTALILNGKAESQSIRFGDMLRYAVTYKNTGNVTIEDVSLSVILDTVPADKVLLWNALKDRAKGVRSGNRITWTKQQIPSLSKIAAGEEGTLDFEIPVLAAPLPDVKDGIYQITNWLEAEIARIDGADVKRSTKTAPIVAKITSDTKLGAQARYFNEDDIPVGSGPLPPEVGKPTTYRIYWTVENGLHELTDLRLSAKLPANVAWSGISSVDAGNLRFDAAAEKMIWTLNWLPTTIKKITVTYDVTITPTEDQKGGIPTLVDASIFEATDKSTGTSLLLSQPPLTTALENDENASGKGRVQ